MTCSWKDPNNPIKPINNYKIGILFDIKTPEGFNHYENVQMMTEIMNEEGGINGVNIELILPNTSITNYLLNISDIIHQMNDVDDVIAFIGTSTPEERKLVNPILKSVGKLLYVFLRGEGEVTYSNIVFMNSIPSQLIEYPFTIIAGRSIGASKILLYDETIPFSKSSYEYIIALSKQLNVEFEQIEKVTDSTNFTTLVTDWKTGLCSSDKKCYILLFIKQNTEKFFNAFYDAEIDPEIHKIVTFDLIKSDINNMENPEVINKHYYVSSYLSSSKLPANTIITDLVKKYKGSPEALLNEETVGVYNILNGLVSVYNQVDVKSTDENTRLVLYATDIDAPQGMMDVKENNIASTYSSIIILNNQRGGTMYSEYPLPIEPVVYSPLV